jgi:hypothetical protein
MRTRTCARARAHAQVKAEWDNYEASYGKEAGEGIKDRSKTTQLVDVFYSLVRAGCGVTHVLLDLSCSACGCLSQLRATPRSGVGDHVARSCAAAPSRRPRRA